MLSEVSLGDGIVKIPAYTFEGCVALKSIVLPDTLTSMGVEVFKGSGIESIILTGNISTVSAGMFMDCASLTKVEFKGSILVIDDYAFANCTALTDIELPETLMTLGTYAFGNTKLKSIELSSVFSSLGNGAFTDCKDLTTITIAADNPYYTMVDGVMMNDLGEYVFTMPNFGAADGKLVISDENAIIAAAGQAPFYGNAQITEVVVRRLGRKFPLTSSAV
jgi:hypothetical protein